MSSSAVQDIERAIEHLTPAERRELFTHLDQQMSDAFDAQIESDLAAGRLDHLLTEAIREDEQGLTRPL